MSPKDAWRALLDGIGLTMPGKPTSRDMFNEISSWWRNTVFTSHPEGWTLAELKRQKEAPTTVFQQGTPTDPVVVGDQPPAMPVSVSKPTLPALEPGTPAKKPSAAAIVAQRGGAVDPTGAHVPSKLTQAEIQQRKEEQQKKIQAVALAAKAKRAAAASTQKQFFNRFAGAKVPLSDLQTKSLAFFQNELNVSGTNDADMPKWQAQKARDFVKRIKHGFKGLKGDISTHDEDALFPLLARDAADFLKNQKLGNNWTDLKNWGPAGGRVHGSMPAPDEIRSGLMHVLAHEQRRRTRPATTTLT